MDKSIRILVTKELPKEDIACLSTSLLKIICIPFIKIEYHIANRSQVLALLEKPVNAIITSQNTINALLENFGKEIVSKARWKIYCIGFATQQKIETYFTHSTIVDSAKNINTLLPKMITAEAHQFYFFGSNIRQQYWIDELKTHHKQVEEYPVYHTLLTPQKIDCSSYEAIIFYSPSAVDSFFQGNNIDINIAIFAIGDTTANAIKKYGNYNVIIAVKPTMEDIAVAIHQYFRFDI